MHPLLVQTLPEPRLQPESKVGGLEPQKEGCSCLAKGNTKTEEWLEAYFKDFEEFPVW